VYTEVIFRTKLLSALPFFPYMEEGGEEIVDL